MSLLLPQRAQENQTYLVRAFTCGNNKASEHCNIRENGSIVERIYHCNKEKKTADSPECFVEPASAEIFLTHVMDVKEIVAIVISFRALMRNNKAEKWRSMVSSAKKEHHTFTSAVSRKKTRRLHGFDLCLA